MDYFLSLFYLRLNFEFKVFDFCNMYSDVHNLVSMCLSFNYCTTGIYVPSETESYVKLWSVNKASDFSKNMEQCDL